MFNLAVNPHFLLHCKIINAKSFLRSSHPEVFCKKDVLRKFAKFLGKTCARVSFNKITGLPVNFVKILGTSFFIEHLWWLLLFSIETVSSFALLFFSEYIFSNCLKRLKQFCLSSEKGLKKMKIPPIAASK